MNAAKRNPGQPIENLAIGKIIEVDGSRIIAELDPGLARTFTCLCGGDLPNRPIRIDCSYPFRTAPDLCSCRKAPNEG